MAQEKNKQRSKKDAGKDAAVRGSRRISRTAGLAPGTLVHVGEERAGGIRITFLDYDKQNFQEKEVAVAKECFPLRDTQTISWINIDGIHDTVSIEQIGKCYKIHPLVLEDIVNTEQRPKLEDFGTYCYVVLKMLTFDETECRIVSEQVSLILGHNHVISFQETIGDIFDSVRERIRQGKGIIREMGPDYLLYNLLDALVDGYFVILEKMGERLEGLEEEAIKNPEPHLLQRIHHVKNQMGLLRRSVWPLREVVGGLARSASPLVTPAARPFFRDVYDHTIQVIETMETYRDMVSGLLDVYLSSVSNRTNEIMKVVTIFAAIFIPLTFITGVYGMNFNTSSPFNMPELTWRYGYPFVWGLMIATVVLMLALFKRKKWL